MPERPPAAAPAARRPPLWVLILATALAPFAMQAQVPALPGMAREFGTDFGTMQLSLGAYLLGMAAGQLFYGPLSDRFGRRLMLLAGMAVFLAGTLVCLAAWDVLPLAAGRACQALGGCSGVVLSRAIVRDLFERERAAQMIAYITAGMILAPTVAPLVSGHLYQWFGWRSVFWLVLAFGAVAVWTCFALLHETHVERARQESFRQLWRGCGALLRQRRFCGYAFQVAFTTASFYSFLGSASLVAIDIFGRSAAGYGWWFVLISGCYMAGNIVSARIGARVGSDRMIAIGTAFSMAMAAVLLAVLLAGGLDVAGFFLLAGAMSVGHGFSMPNGFAGTVSVDPRRAGTASGLAGALQMTIGAAAMTAVGQTLTDSPLPVVLAMLAMAVLAWLAHLRGVAPTCTGSPIR